MPGSQGMVRFMPVFHREEPGGTGSGQAEIADFFKALFRRDFAMLTSNGRRALAAVLESLALEPTDEICILTTFGFPNVSSCVTSTVFNYCKPARVMSPATRGVIVIHEFGVPFKDMTALSDECMRRGIPLIEDCR